jgi:hypothetical protein
VLISSMRGFRSFSQDNFARRSLCPVWGRRSLPDPIRCFCCAKLLVHTLLLQLPASSRVLGVAPSYRGCPYNRAIDQCRSAFSLSFRCMAGMHLGGFITALLCIAIAARESGSIGIPLALSFGFLCASFLADRMFMNKVVVRSYQVSVSLDGNAPWGTVGPEWPDATKPTVLYRRVGDGYCYIALKSKELGDRLANEHRATVSMQINIFKDFGIERGYNVRSVDGLLLADGPKVVRDAERFGGHVLDRGVITSSSTDNCW